MTGSPLLLRPALLAFALLTACTSTSTNTGPCVSNADCATGQVCSEGKCYGQVVSAAVTSSSSGASTGHASSAAASSSGASSTSSGSVAASTTSGSIGTVGSNNGTTSGTVGGSTSGSSSGGCSCSSSCCSEIGGNGITCPDGKACYGTTDAGVPFYCNYQTGKCDPFDPCDGASGVYTCGGSTGTSGTTGGIAAVDPMGLSFVVVGDTRPGDTSSPYPQATINAIYTDFNSLSPAPMAVIATGDFQEDGDSSSATSMIDDYETATRLYTNGPTYPVMGNHECVSTSITTYCSIGSGGMSTVNFQAYLQMLVDLSINPNTNSQPYYYKTVTAPNGDTAKFISTAAQAWDSTQLSWLESTLAVPSTFTFLGRHEPDDAVGCTDSTAGDNTTNNCPFIAQVQTAINAAPGSVTLKLTGHTHEIRFDNDNDAIVSGSGGAPIETTCSSNSTSTTYCNFGYVYCQELVNKTFLCTAYDMTSGAVSTPSPRIAANGTPTGTLTYAP